MERKDIRIGDRVVIEKGGDVIPKVVEVVYSARSEESVPWAVPTHCPSCGAEALQEEGEVAVRCPNSDFCPAQQLRTLVFFVSKPAFAVDFRDRGDRVGVREAAEREKMQGLLKDADVFLQGYRPGAIAGHGLAPEEIAAVRPGIVCASLSAYGHEGPWRDR